MIFAINVHRLHFLNFNSQSNWADQVPIAIAPLKCVPYTGLPLDGSDDTVVYDQPMMVYLPEQPTEKEKDALMAGTKRGVLVTGNAANGLMALTMGSYNPSESDDKFLFRLALPGVSDDEKFKCEIRMDGDIVIQGMTNTWQKEVQPHNMTFDMYTQYLCPPGDFEVRFHLPANVDPSTLEWSVQMLQQRFGFIDIDKINPDAWPALIEVLPTGENGIETLEPFPLPSEVSVVKAAVGWAYCVCVTVAGEVYTWGWKECVPFGTVVGDPYTDQYPETDLLDQGNITHCSHWHRNMVTVEFTNYPETDFLELLLPVLVTNQLRQSLLAPLRCNVTVLCDIFYEC
ncbi:putative regulator of chromosome condensation 1/beta-lactamase-inhibitor protein II [Helianthus anomalus]